MNCLINAEPTESYGGTLCAGDQSLALPSIALSSTFASVSNAFSTTASNVTQLTQISAPPGATHFTKVWEINPFIETNFSTFALVTFNYYTV